MRSGQGSARRPHVSPSPNTKRDSNGRINDNNDGQPVSLMGQELGVLFSLL